MFWEQDIYKSTQKEDLVEFTQFLNKIKGTKFVSPHMLWDFKHKAGTSDQYDEGYLTS